MKNFDSVISTEAGLITGNLYQIPNRTFLPKGLWQTSCDSQNNSLLGSNLDVIQGSAIGFNLQHSLKATIGEFCERYSASCQNRNSFIRGTYRDVSASAQYQVLHPSRIKPYADWQYSSKSIPYLKLTEEEDISWVKGIDLSNNMEVLIPAFLVYLPHNNMFDNGKDFILNTSTGVSAGRTINEAVEGGLLECLERDAFSNFWYNQKSLVGSIPLYNQETVVKSFPNNTKIKSLYRNPHVKIYSYDLTELGLVNTVLVILFYNYKNRLMLSTGASSRFDKSDAFVKAALEAYQGIEYGVLLYNNEQEWTENGDNFENVDSFQKHFAFYNKFPEMRKHVPILENLQNTKNFKSQLILQNSDKQIKDLDQFKKQNDISAYYVDLTTEDVRQIGYNVVRVLSPELSYLTGVHQKPFLGSLKFQNKQNLFLEYPHLFP